MSIEKSFVPQEKLNTAVLFMIFNRLDVTRQVFDAIRQAKPPRLYIGADGARDDRPGDEEKVQAVRDYVLSGIDWDCEVKTLFREKNLGCKYAPNSAINWFFENEDQGIILEDDCLPSQSFFWFCEELLEKYKDDLRVWLISGDNFQNDVIRGDGSYYFSRFTHIWGWASWADRWSKNDVEMNYYNSISMSKVIHAVLPNARERGYWESIFKDVANQKIWACWDYQWTATVWCNNGLTVLPNRNLISNIGFGPEATHTADLESVHSRLPRFEIDFPLRHPQFVVEDFKADRYTAKYMFIKTPFIKKVIKKIVRTIKSFT